MAEKGGISVQTEHIFPIIKKWLYSDKDIFLRELVSNASDAVVKLKHLSAIGQAKNISGDFFIKVIADKENRTLTVSDNGIGMSEEEIKKYINQIALSGALDFIQKYDNTKATETDNSSGIIGHFGLGFYSAFMVAEKVTIKTKSFTDAPAMVWVCNDEGEYEMQQGDREERGTDVILTMYEDELEYLEEFKLTEVLEKYCSFMPIKIYLEIVGKEEEKSEDDAEESSEPKPINDTEPLWQKSPSQCTDEEYAEFYKKVFRDFKEPLFHIHINADYPLNFKGILYFPKIGNEYENMEGQVKLYYNRVFVSDNIKEIIPEYLLMLKGVLDCPELPLNVSRSYLQDNAYVKKLSDHIVKKVCDKLVSLFDTEREKYHSFWEDLKPFVEYASLRDQKFYQRVKNVIVYKTVDNEYLTLNEYIEKSPKNSDNKKNIYYANDTTQQAVYINMFKNEQIPVIVLDKLMDNQFITAVEHSEKDVHFLRIDANTDAIKENDGSEIETLKKLFIDISGNEKLTVNFTALKDEKIPAILNISEESRRFNDMMKMYSMINKDTNPKEIYEESTLILNTNNSLIKKLETLCVDSPSDIATAIAKQIYTLALVGQRQLTADELSEFLDNSFNLLERL